MSQGLECKLVYFECCALYVLKTNLFVTKLSIHLVPALVDHIGSVYVANFKLVESDEGNILDEP
jgi:hypothetical protein